MAGAFPVLSGVGTTANAYAQSTYQQNAAQAQANAGYYNAAVARNNASAVMQAAIANKADQDKQNRAMLESVRSKYLASGVALSGTPLLVLSDTAAQGALSSARILHQGEVQAAGYENQANLQTWQGDQALAIGESQAHATLLGGMLSGASQIGQSIFKSMSNETVGKQYTYNYKDSGAKSNGSNSLIL
jgi:hypothetical protein